MYDEFLNVNVYDPKHQYKIIERYDNEASSPDNCPTFCPIVDVLPLNTGIPKTGTPNEKIDFENELSPEKNGRINHRLKKLPLTRRQMYKLSMKFGDRYIESG